MTADELKRNIDTLFDRVRKASAQEGTDVAVVAATKTVPPDVIALALEFGITDIGENRVQEFLDKKGVVSPERWHFIGALQRNKVKYLVGSVALIQSVDGLALAEEINRIAVKRGVVQDVLLEVNAAGEPNKSGVAADMFDELLYAVRRLPNVNVRGVMSVPPKDAGDEVYRSLYALFDKHRGGAFDTLSVGMSGDYEKAIAFGANMIRPGTAVFGERIYV